MPKIQVDSSLHDELRAWNMQTVGRGVEAPLDPGFMEVSQDVLDRLKNLRRPGETYTDVIRRAMFKPTPQG